MTVATPVLNRNESFKSLQINHLWSLSRLPTRRLVPDRERGMVTKRERTTRRNGVAKAAHPRAGAGEARSGPVFGRLCGGFCRETRNLFPNGNAPAGHAGQR